MEKKVSQKRSDAARANGARSRGPKTPEGKERSSQNALRHGLLAKCVLIPGERPENFQALFQMHVDRFSPLDDVEFGMIEEMAASFWRQRRAWTIETEMFEDALRHQPAGDRPGRMAEAFIAMADSNHLALLHRYEARLHTMYQRALRSLILLRKAPRPQEPQPGLPPSASPPPQPMSDPAAPHQSALPNEPKKFPVSNESIASALPQPLADPAARPVDPRPNPVTLSGVDEREENHAGKVIENAGGVIQGAAGPAYTAYDTAIAGNTSRCALIGMGSVGCDILLPS